MRSGVELYSSTGRRTRGLDGRHGGGGPIAGQNAWVDKYVTEVRAESDGAAHRALRLMSRSMQADRVSAAVSPGRT
jgi:hypothetical protein